MQGSFHPIAFQLTTNESQAYVQSFLQTVDVWVRALYGESFLRNVKHTMSDRAKAILNAFSAVCPWAEQHSCWFHIKQMLEKKVQCCYSVCFVL